MIWMSGVNGQMEVDRERMMWELIGRPNMVYAAAAVCWTGACRKLESVQFNAGKRLLGASNTVAGWRNGGKRW